MARADVPRLSGDKLHLLPLVRHRLSPRVSVVALVCQRLFVRSDDFFPANASAPTQWSVTLTVSRVRFEPKEQEWWWWW